MSRGRAGGAGEGGRPTGGSRHHPSGLLVRCAALLSNAGLGRGGKICRLLKAWRDLSKHLNNAIAEVFANVALRFARIVRHTRRCHAPHERAPPSPSHTPARHFVHPSAASRPPNNA